MSVGEPVIPAPNHPRVLVVSINRVNRADNDNAAFLVRNLFGDWPKDRLAQIYSGANNGDAGFVGAYHELGPDDRLGGTLFYRLKARAIPAPDAAAGTPSADRAHGRALGVFARRLIQAGLYDWPFPPRVSAGLASFLRNFRPQIIYANGYTLGFSRLPVTIHEHFGTPIVFHTSDDWAGSLGARGLLRPFSSRVVQGAARRLVNAATLRWAFNEPMAEEYQRRYRCHFDVVPNGDCPERFPREGPLRRTGARIIGVFGSLADRWQSVVLLADALQHLPARCGQHMVRCHATAIPPEGRSALSARSNVALLPSPSHDAVPRCMAGCDILAIVESFEPARAAQIRLSVSTKAHLFMFSRRPILVFAPAESGVAQYARNQGWGMVVPIADTDEVARAVARLALDRQYVELLVSRAHLLASERHDLRKIRAAVAQSLSSVAAARGDKAEWS